MIVFYPVISCVFLYFFCIFIILSVFVCTSSHSELYETCKIKPYLDCNYFFLFDLASNRILFSAKSIGKV